MTADPEKIITPRQLELLALYATGYNYDEIAEMKFLSRWTVRNYLLQACERMETRNLTHLAVVCVDAGLIRKNGQGFRPVQVEGVIAE